MMETIASWIAEALGELLELIVSLFLNLMSVNLGTIAGQFPYLVTGFKMFQAIGIGLIICVAAFQIFKFFGGQLVEVQDHPFRILIRAFIAGMLVFFGGYLVEMLINIAALPYQAFIETEGNGELVVFAPLDDFSLDAFFIDASSIAFGASTIILAYVLIMGVIGWNIIKLLVEVLERYMMVALLAFTAPVFYSTLTSQSTSNIFRNWCSMLVGQCALLGVSAWMLKLIISGFSYSDSGEGMAFQLLLTLALCKIAQRVDTYLQTLGLGVATTGANLMDETLAGVMMLSRSFGQRSERADKADTKTTLGDKQNENQKAIIDNGKPNTLPRTVGRSMRTLSHAKPGGILNDIDRARYFGDAIKQANTAYKETEGDLLTKGKSFKDTFKDVRNEQIEPDTADSSIDFQDRNRNLQLQKSYAQRFDDAVPMIKNKIGEAKNSLERWGGNISDSAKQIYEDPVNGTVSVIRDLGKSVIKPKPIGGFEVNPENPEEIVADRQAIKQGISIDKAKGITSDSVKKTSKFITDNISSLGESEAGTQAITKAFDNDNKVAENVLRNTDISAETHTEKNSSNINEIGQSAIEHSFEGGLSKITGDEQSNVENFTSKLTAEGERNVQFTTTDKDGISNAYSLHSGPIPPTKNSESIQSSNGQRWWIDKKARVNIDEYKVDKKLNNSKLDSEDKSKPLG